MSRGMGHVMRSLRLLVEEHGWIHLASAASLIYRGKPHEAVEKKHHVAVRRAANRLVAGGGFDLEDVRATQSEKTEIEGQLFTVETMGLALISGQSRFTRSSKFERVKEAAKELGVSVATIYRDLKCSWHSEDGCLQTSGLCRLPSGLEYHLVNTKYVYEATDSTKAGGKR